MPDIQITITNLPQIRAAFSRAPALMTEELNKAIKETLLTIQAQSMRNTPVLTGRLRASTRSLFTNLAGEVGTHTNYDIFVHNGTKFMAARPYLKDAVEETSGSTLEFFHNAVQNVLNKIGDMV